MSAAKTFGQRGTRSKSVYKWYPYGETLLDDRDLPEMNKDGRAAKCNCAARLFYTKSKALRKAGASTGKWEENSEFGEAFFGDFRAKCGKGSAAFPHALFRAHAAEMDRIFPSATVCRVKTMACAPISLPFMKACKRAAQSVMVGLPAEFRSALCRYAA